MYLTDLYKYWRKAPPGERITLFPIPKFMDKSHPTARHYFQQDCWLIRKLCNVVPSFHVSFGGRIDGLVGQLASAGVSVMYCDINRPEIYHDLVTFRHCDLTDTHFKDNLFESVSCLHTIEHIGLGRYGDTINPDGDKEAIAELKRIVKPGGDLFVSVPVGKKHTAFNGHRIYNAYEFHEMWLDTFKVIEYAVIDSQERMSRFRDIPARTVMQLEHHVALDKERYACALWHLKKV